jgi:hypothetical protein
MSHVTPINLEIKDLEALKMACERLGLTWMEGQKTYRWYGRFVGDYPMPEGFTVKDLGKCSHAIRVPGASYEIGVVERNGENILMWDFYYSGGLEKVLGQGGYKLKQAYSIEAAKLQAFRDGYTNFTEEVDQNGDIHLTIEVGA